jgi:hypothetical protein
VKEDEKSSQLFFKIYRLQKFSPSINDRRIEPPGRTPTKLLTMPLIVNIFQLLHLAASFLSLPQEGQGKAHCSAGAQ